MRRPFALLGFSVFAALTLAAWAGPAAAQAGGWCCGALALCAVLGLCAALSPKKNAVSADAAGPRFFLSRQKLRRGLAALGAGLTAAAGAFFLYHAAWQLRAAPYLDLEGQKARVQGTVLDYPQEMYQRTYLLLQVDRAAPAEEGAALPELPGPFTLRVSSALPLLCEPGQVVECTVTFTEFSQTGLYSSQARRLAQGISAGAYLSDFEELSSTAGAQTSLSQFFARLRRQAARGFSQHLPGEEAALLQTMLLGTESDLSQQATLDFQRTGTTHLLVISGLHLTILAGFLSLVLGALPLDRVARNLLLIALLLGFLAVTGFPVSAQRAGLMQILFYLGGCFGRRPEGCNSLGFSVLCICLSDPFSGGDLGFALSVMSTLGLLVFRAPIARGMGRLAPRGRLGKKLWRPIAESLSITFAVTAFTLPLQVAVFGTLPLAAPLANLVLIFPSSLLLYCGFLSALLLLLPVPALAAPFLFAAGWLARFMLWAAGLLSQLPFATLSLGQDAGLLAVGFLLLLLFLAALPGRERRRTKFAALAMAVVLLAVSGLEHLRWRDVLTVAVADAGDASCVVLLKNGKGAVLSLGGYNSSSALQLFQRHNVARLDTVFLPTQDGEARLAALELLGELPARRVLLPAGAYQGKDLGRTGADIQFVEAGAVFSPIEGVEVLYAADGSALTFTDSGVTVMVELEEAAGGSCQVLITRQEQSRVNSSFTVLQSDAIIEEMLAEGEVLSPGTYAQPPEQGSLCLDLTGRGQIQIRRED